MTSSAISLLSTTIVSTAQAPTSGDQVNAAAKVDSNSFASTLEKAGKVKEGNASEIQAVKSSMAKSAKDTSSLAGKRSSAAEATSTAPDQSSKLAETESTVQAEGVTSTDEAIPQATQVIQDVVASNFTPKASDNLASEVKTTTAVADKSAKDDNTISTTADPASVALPAPVIDSVTTAIPNQALPIGTQADTAVKTEDNTLGSSILASISMGKSLDKPASAGDKTLPATAFKLNTAAGTAESSSSPLATGTTGPTSELATGQPGKAASAESGATESNVASAPSSAMSSVVAHIKPQVTDKTADNQPTDTGGRTDSVNTANPVVAGTSATPAQQAANTSSVASVQTPVNNPDWGKSVGQQLVSFHLKGEQDVQLHLNPSNLGPMSITLTVNEHLQATAHFSSHSGQVRSALEQGMGQLRDAMAQQGISLGQTSVGDQRQQGSSQSNQPSQQRYNTDQLTGLSILAADSSQAATTSPVGTGEISTYA